MSNISSYYTRISDFIDQMIAEKKEFQLTTSNPIKPDYLAFVGFKLQTDRPFESVNSDYYLNGILAILPSEQDMYRFRAAIIERRDDKLHAATFRWISTEYELQQVYEAVTGKVLQSPYKTP